MKHLFSLTGSVALAALLLPALTHAQGVGLGTPIPDASAALDIVSSSKGLLPPRVAAVTAISSPATGLIAYQTGGPAGYYYYDGTAWQQLVPASGTGFIRNQTTPQASSNFNINGSGTVAGILTAGGVRLTNVPTAGLVTTDASGNLSSQPQPTLGLNNQTLTLTSGSTSSSVALPISAALTGSFANLGGTTPYFVSPAQASAAPTNATGYYNNTASTAPYVYGVRAPKSGTAQLLFKVIVIPFNGSNPAEQLTIQLYVNGVVANLSATASTSATNYSTTSASTTTGVAVNAGDILTLRVTESSGQPYLQVLTTLVIQ